eukprot:1149828-Pelagomonas_calceolata.AAC.1
MAVFDGAQGSLTHWAGCGVPLLLLLSHVQLLTTCTLILGCTAAAAAVGVSIEQLDEEDRARIQALEAKLAEDERLAQEAEQRCVRARAAAVTGKHEPCAP